jgi:hypothetical protein
MEYRYRVRSRHFGSNVFCCVHTLRLLELFSYAETYRDFNTSWLVVVDLLGLLRLPWDRLGDMALCSVLGSCLLLAWYVVVVNDRLNMGLMKCRLSQHGCSKDTTMNSRLRKCFPRLEGRSSRVLWLVRSFRRGHGRLRCCKVLRSLIDMVCRVKKYGFRMTANSLQVFLGRSGTLRVLPSRFCCSRP